MISEKDMTLAVDFTGQSSLIGWYASEKLNGCRAYWTGRQFWSRAGKPIRAPKWFTEKLPDFPLDGEIHAGRGHGVGNKNTGYICAMTAVVQGSHWWNETDLGNKITFSVIDVPRAKGNWVERMGAIQFGYDRCFTCKIESPKHLAEYMIDLHKKGAEGAMFRNPDESRYHAGQTGALLRWKFLQS